MNSEVASPSWRRGFKAPGGAMTSLCRGQPWLLPSMALASVASSTLTALAQSMQHKLQLAAEVTGHMLTEGRSKHQGNEDHRRGMEERYKSL